MDIYLQCVGVVVVVSRTPDPERVVTLAGSPAEAARVINIVDIVQMFLDTALCRYDYFLNVVQILLEV